MSIVNVHIWSVNVKNASVLSFTLFSFRISLTLKASIAPHSFNFKVPYVVCQKLLQKLPWWHLIRDRNYHRCMMVDLRVPQTKPRMLFQSHESNFEILNLQTWDRHISQNCFGLPYYILRSTSKSNFAGKTIEFCTSSDWSTRRKQKNFTSEILLKMWM